MDTWDAVCDFLETLPEARQNPQDDREVVRVHGKVVAFPARNARSRPVDAKDSEEFVVVKVNPSERAALLYEDPKTFFVTPHYEKYPGIIVRLGSVDPDRLRELLTEAWRLVAPKRLIREYDGETTG